MHTNNASSHILFHVFEHCYLISWLYSVTHVARSPVTVLEKKGCIRQTEAEGDAEADLGFLLHFFIYH